MYVYATRDIPELEQRITRQRALIEEMRVKGEDIELLERQLELFQHGLAHLRERLKFEKARH